jgi:hypothetical protein
MALCVFGESNTGGSLMKTRRVVAVGDYVTLEAAGRAMNKTYWQIRGLIQREQIKTLRLGSVNLVRITDLEQAGEHERAIRA